MTQSEAVGTLVLTNTPVMEKEPVMTASDVGYDHIHTWIKSILGPVHATVRVTVAWALLCLLLAQRATPAALARALPAEQAGSGRACLRRVRRWWCGPPLEQVYISPRLIHLALTGLPPGTSVVVALDTTRLGPWEVWLAGIVVAGRTLPIGWAVIPYPWPKGRLRSTTLALIQQLQRAFPTGVRWTLVADRGFPSAALFAQLRQGGTDFSVRRRLSDWVTVGKVYAMVVDHLEAGRLGGERRTTATMGGGRPDQPLVPGWIVVSTAVAVPPQHKQTPGTLRERAARARRHAQHRKHKQGRQTPPPSAAVRRYGQTWVLCTTAPTVAQAGGAYAGRMSIEETYRDWHHHWAVRWSPLQPRLCQSWSWQRRPDAKVATPQGASPMDVGVGLAAFAHALAVARPDIFTSAQGAPCTRLDCTGRLASVGIHSRMDGRGRALDHVFVERRWRTVTYAEVYLGVRLNSQHS